VTECSVKPSPEAVVDLDEKRLSRVLFVDDELGLLKAAKQCLEMKDEFQVDTASSAGEAMEKMRKQEYDVVVSDYQMPEKNGLEFLKEVRESGNDIPFIVFTGKGREEVVIRALNSGADRYISKSGDPETVYAELKHAIREAVRVKSAESELQESQMRYRNLVENAPDVIYAISENGKLASLNSAFERLTGWKCSEWVGKSFASLVHPDDLDTAMETFEKTLRGERLPPYELRVLSKSGEYLVGEFTSRPWSEKGKIVGEFGVARDVTVRKKAEEALRASEEKHRVISSITTDFVFSCLKMSEGSFAIDWTVGATEKLFGYSSKEIRDKGCWKFVVQPQDLPTFEERVTGLKPGQSSVCELRITHKDGSTRWIKASSQVTKDSSNPANHRLFGACEDITERKRMEEALLDSEAKWRSITENSPDNIMLLDPDANILFINHTVPDMTGEQVIGTPVFKYIPSEFRQTVKVCLERVLKTGKPDQCEVNYHMTDGKIRKFENRVGPVECSGKIVGVAISCRDVTERKQMEEVLRESEEKYRKQFEEALDAIFLADADTGIILDCNRAATELVDREKSGLIGKHQRILHPPEKIKGEFSTTFKQHLKEKEGRVLETQVITKNGEIKDVAIKANLFELQGKKMLQGTFRDIAERKKTEKAIRESQQKFEALFMGNPEAGVFLDSDFHIVDINPCFEELFGYHLDEIKGKRLNDVVVQKDKAEEAEMLDRKAIDGYVYRDTLRLRKDGSLIPVSISAAPITAEGKLVGYVGVYKNISEQKSAERKLAVMNEKLRVVGGLTRHDVRNKLGVITANTYLIKKRSADHPEIADNLTDMETACYQIARIFDCAKDYEMLGVEELTYVDVVETVQKAVSLFSDLQGIEINNECHGLTVLADSLLRQLFYNLIDNSLKYGKKATHIRIFFEKAEGDKLNIVYEDDGVGVPATTKPKIFAEGYTTGKGSGYGLFLISKLMEVYGWTIQETGEPGTGVRFIMTLPKTNENGKTNYRLS
jgi:PAS domain S-box-containing protein